MKVLATMILLLLETQWATSGFCESKESRAFLRKVIGTWNQLIRLKRDKI
jgi:hypothetical protein